jgi:sulfate permease, SulP family
VRLANDSIRDTVLRLDGGLFFATAEALEDRVRGPRRRRSEATCASLDLEGLDLVDSQGAAKLTQILEPMRANGVTLRLARVKPAVHKVLRADGIIERIGVDHIHGNVHRAIESQLTDDGRQEARRD